LHAAGLIRGLEENSSGGLAARMSLYYPVAVQYHIFKEFPMKVRIDPDLCTGCGLCSDSVPDVFKMGDDIAEVIAADVPANLESAVQEAVDDCPAEAILVE
jgi:ferredoxin